MKTVRVSAAVIMSGGRVYATKRGKGTYRGLWEFPGGKQEVGESGEEAARREIAEELGAVIEVGKKLCTVRYQYPEFFLIMDCYLSRVKAGELKLIEHLEARWLSADELDSVSWLPADEEAVKVLRKYLQEN